MDFLQIYESFSKDLEKIGKKHRNLPPHLDHQDVVSEMTAHLWKSWKQGELEHKTKSYILQSCQFRALNYLRGQRAKISSVCLDISRDGEERSLEEAIPGLSSYFTDDVEDKLTVEAVKDCDLTVGERRVLELCLQGYKVREIGRELSISHVRVIKIRKNIRSKLEARASDILH